MTKAEEDIMMIIWKINEHFNVGMIRDYIEEQLGLEKPAHSNVSTFLKNLVDKSYLTYKVYGRTFLYNPLISQKEYSKSSLLQFIGLFFDSSPKELVSFLVKENDLSLKDLNDIAKAKSSSKTKK